jgi:hypothetical protein
MGKLLKVVNADASNGSDYSGNTSAGTWNTNGDGNGISFGERTRGAGRKGKSGWKHKVPRELTKDQDHQQYKGANDHPQYQSVVMQVVTIVAQEA